jgi:hypothetical protein
VTTTSGYLPSTEELQASLGSLGAADLVLLSTHALRVGNLDYALALSELGPPDPALRVTHAAALFGRGHGARALEVIEQVLTEQPDHLGALFYGAQMLAQKGETARAMGMLLRVLERFPDFPGAHGLLSGLRFPGPLYRDILQRLHEILAPQRYLEIGVETGATLGFARSAELIVGVDPDDSKLRRDLLPPNARFFKQTSDDFFARHTRQELFGSEGVDFAYIDGMHLFEYALRDFVNAEAWCKPDGAIVLHDCVPITKATASRERRTNFWVGDVWKVVSILREHRPELKVKIIATAPSGLTVIRGLNPASTLLSERLPDIIERYRDLAYPADGLELPQGFELVPPNAAGLRQALS